MYIAETVILQGHGAKFPIILQFIRQTVQIPEPRQTGVLVRRYKRFLADIRLTDGSVLTVHCPNSGSMLGCSTPGSPVIISRSENSGRKYAWTLEMVKNGKVWIGVNTFRTNKLVREGLAERIIDEFGSIRSITPEIRVSAESRLDFLLETENGSVYVEVKNCSLAENGIAMFPDAVTGRGTRHLQELARLRDMGYGAALIFCIQRPDVSGFMPAGAIDPLYAETLQAIHRQGVTVLAYRAEVQPDRINIACKVPVSCTYAMTGAEAL